MPRQTIQPPALFDSKQWGFSQVVVSPPGRIVHIAGQVACDSDENIVSNEFQGQLRQALENVLIAARAAGAESDDLQAIRLYIPNLNPQTDTAVIARVLVEMFGVEAPPASSWIGVQSLADPEYLVEVEATAVVPA